MNRRDTVVVLGGNEDQLPAYHAAQRIGYRVVGVDMRADCLGAHVADEFLAVSTREPMQIATLLDGSRVAAVLSPASDVAQESVAALSDKFDTPFRIPAKAVRASVDKGYFREVVAALGLPGYASVQDADPERLATAAAALRLPVVIKPSDSSGSKGLTYVTDAAQLPAAIAEAGRNSRTGQVIAEEFVAGTHHSAECFFSDGRLQHAGITTRTLTGPPHLISLSHIVPDELPADVRTRVHETIVTIAGAVDLTAGPLNLDFIVTADGEVVVVEMGARLGGNGMPLLCEWAYGIDTVTAAVRLALGEHVTIEPQFERVAALHILHSDVGGVLRSIDGIDHVRAMPGVKRVVTFVEPGGEVHPYNQAKHKIGYLMLVTDEQHEIRHLSAEALRSITWQLDPLPPT